MMDLLENTEIMCRNCKVPMERGFANKEGFKLRAFQCPKCKTKFLHPSDLDKYNQYKELKEREFNMKLRRIGNSFCISIPREIIRFNHVEENSFVSLSMENGEIVRMAFHQRKVIGGQDEDDER